MRASSPSPWGRGTAAAVEEGWYTERMMKHPKEGEVVPNIPINRASPRGGLSAYSMTMIQPSGAGMVPIWIPVRVL